jgi:PAT family beta-lactamase induction signal transducer AmpG
MTQPASSHPESISPQTRPAVRNPWAWVPTLYLAEGLPYAVVIMVAGIMYKGLGISNSDITLFTGGLYLPWVIKPLWSPVVDILKTRRQWIWVMQLLIGAGMAGLALSLPTANFFRYSLAVLWVLAFNSATHDIAADGFYMLATTPSEQAFFVGIRSTFYRISMISGQGLLVILAGLIQSNTGLPKLEIQINARSAAALIEMSTVENWLQMPLASASNGVPHFVAEPAVLDIRPEPLLKEDAKALIAIASQWNTTNGFYRLHSASQTADKKEARPSWWKEHVANPLGGWLRRYFGPETKAKTDLAGNVGLVRLKLSAPPEMDIVTTLTLQSGNISITEGARLVFDRQNWERGALIAIQLDPKLKTESSAVCKLRSGNIPLSWSVTYFGLAGLFLCFGLYHRFILPWPASDRPGTANSVFSFLGEFFKTFGSFFRKGRIWALLLFLLFYRFAEAQLVSLVKLFLLDGREVGGLGLTTGQVGFAYGTVGIIALTLGGILGGMVAARGGLKAWLWPMVLIMHLPDAMFVYLAYAQPDNFPVINLSVAIEQFGYGFGFTAYMLYMIYIARGQHETAHYAICTGFMALGMMLPGMFSGWLQEIIGYQHFFVWVMLATIPGFVVVLLIPLDAQFGKKSASPAVS